jgi:hypothetical protein
MSTYRELGFRASNIKTVGGPESRIGLSLRKLVAGLSEVVGSVEYSNDIAQSGYRAENLNWRNQAQVLKKYANNRGLSGCEHRHRQVFSSFASTKQGGIERGLSVG